MLFLGFSSPDMYSPIFSYCKRRCEELGKSCAPSAAWKNQALVGQVTAPESSMFLNSWYPSKRSWVAPIPFLHIATSEDPFSQPKLGYYWGTTIPLSLLPGQQGTSSNSYYGADLTGSLQHLLCDWLQPVQYFGCGEHHWSVWNLGELQKNLLLFLPSYTQVLEWWLESSIWYLIVQTDN